MQKKSFWKKAVLVFMGVALSLFLLEVGLRVGGFILSSVQEYENLRSAKQKGVYRILCLGESTTAGQYPRPLEQVLNQRNIGVRFSVIDKGKPGIKTLFIVSQVESYLAEYRPDMVVAMMGINDTGVTYYQDIPDPESWLFKHIRIYRFGRILCMHLLKRLRKKDIYAPGREDRERKSGPDNQGTAIEKAGLPSEVSVDRMAGSAPKKDKDSLEVTGSPQQGDNLFDPPKFFRKKISNLKLGRLYRTQGRFSRAENFFKKAIELNPKDDKAYCELGDIYCIRGEFSQAEDSFKKAIALNPRNEQAYVKLGLLYRSQGDLSAAEDLLRKAIELNPENNSAYFGLGWVYRERGELSQAEDLFKKAIELNPENDNAYYELGKIHRKQGDLSRAEDSFRRAFGINPKHERLLGEMSLLYEEMGKQDLAKWYSEKARRLLRSGDCALTAINYHKLKNILDQKGIKLVCVQYPVRNVEPLKKIFEKNEGVIFVDNEWVFKKALRKGNREEYFLDMFGGDFGHCTPKGNMLLAENIADVILREVFNKR